LLFLAQDKIVKLGILNAMSEERLDRIESLIEKIGQKVESNAKSIEALTHSITEERDDDKIESFSVAIALMFLSGCLGWRRPKLIFMKVRLIIITT